MQLSTQLWLLWLFAAAGLCALTAKSQWLLSCVCVFAAAVCLVSVAARLFRLAQVFSSPFMLVVRTRSDFRFPLQRRWSASSLPRLCGCSWSSCPSSRSGFVLAFHSCSHVPLRLPRLCFVSASSLRLFVSFAQVFFSRFMLACFAP